MSTSVRSVARHVFRSVFEDRLVVVAPGVAYYMMLGIMPALAALILIYGLIADPLQVQQHFDQLRPAIPDEAADLLAAQIERVAEERTVAGWGAAISIVLLLWAGSYAMGVLVSALNIAFDTKETRGYIELLLLRLALTVGGIVLALLATGILVAVPLMVGLLPMEGASATALLLLRWPALLLLGMTGLSVLYQWGPDRTPPSFRWLTWGSAIASILWVIASSAFAFYMDRIEVHEDFLGAFGAVVVLMLWLLISAAAVLLGAEIDAAIERERRSNPTVAARPGRAPGSPSRRSRG